MKSKTFLVSRAFVPCALAALCSVRAADVFSAGHGDIGIAYDAGALDPHWHLLPDAMVNGSPLAADAEYAPPGVLAYVAGPSLARPAGTQWDFLGTAAGNPIWFLPQGEDPAKPFLGIASEELTPAEWNSLKLTLVAASGPTGGHFSLWQSDLFGAPSVKMTTSDGVSAADGISLTVGGHDHFNYGFSQPGIYDLTFQWDGEHAVDGVVSATGTYRFGVTAVPESSTTAMLVLGAIALLARRRTRQ